MFLYSLDPGYVADTYLALSFIVALGIAGLFIAWLLKDGD